MTPDRGTSGCDAPKTAHPNHHHTTTAARLRTRLPTASTRLLLASLLPLLLLLLLLLPYRARQRTLVHGNPLPPSSDRRIFRPYPIKDRNQKKHRRRTMRPSLLPVLLGVLRVRSAASQGFPIVDATAGFVPSTESTYDHMVELEDNLFFHWNDIAGDRFTGRLVHESDSFEQAPSWLAFGVYHSNHNYTELPTSDLMIGSTAMIGLVTNAETPSPAQHFHLGGKSVEGITSASDDTSYTETAIFQHDRDNGRVVTDLSFTKALEGSHFPHNNLRREGANVFLWAVGPPEALGEALGKHSLKGVMYLDLSAVQQSIEGVSATEGEASRVTGDGSGSNLAPVIQGQCGSSILTGKDAGEILLTPALTFHWRLVSGGTKVQIALEYSGEEAWLGTGPSYNGLMIGSSAVIASPGNDDLSFPPTHYNLNDKDITGLESDASVLLEDASVQSATNPNDPSKITTVLQYTKLLDDPNDSVPISKGLTTFVYAVGASRQLAYHEHRGAFQVDLEDCGGHISFGAVYSHTGLFATHGMFAALAFALATPFAVTVAWFRTLLPASWIYIHVFANVFTFIATILIFILAIIGVGKEEAATHFSLGHHYVGTLLVFVVSFQVVNGFLRPPVKRKDPNRPELPPNTWFGLIPIPRNPRERWQFLHRCCGVTAVAGGIYQMQSGLRLYSERFGTYSMVSFYWVYVGLFFVGLCALKLWVYVEEERARQGVMEAVSTTEPTALEEQKQYHQQQNLHGENNFESTAQEEELPIEGGTLS